MNLMIKLQLYLLNKSTKKECLGCGESVVPKKQISLFNVGIYVIIAIGVYLATKVRSSVFLPIIMVGINSFFEKPRCYKCKGIEFKD